MNPGGRRNQPPAVILVVEDDASFSWVLRRGLEQQGYAVEAAADGAAAVAAHARCRPAAVVMDIRLPRLSGLRVLERLKAADASCPVIIITAQNTMQNAVDAMKLGAFEYLVKPFDLAALYRCLERALAEPPLLPATVRAAAAARPEAAEEAADLRDAAPAAPRLIGRSAAMQEVFKIIGRVAQRDITVLISGESGTGKELVARALHENSQRAGKPFAPVNCAAIAPHLLESELFGHVRGAFTGAIADHPGKFLQAQGGTIFLDEIGDMEAALQRKILRVLQEREVEPVGGRSAVKVDVRIIAATHQDLAQAVRRGEFRTDLYYRLNVIPIRLPPLRERLDDVPLLAHEFVARAAAELQLPVKMLAPRAMQLLQRYPWPGNVRELENAIRRAMVLASEPTIQAEHLPLLPPAESSDEPGRAPAPDLRALLQELVDHAMRQPPDLPAPRPTGAGPDEAEAPQPPRSVGAAGLYDAVLGQLEALLVETVLQRTAGNQSRAAELLGMHRNTLRKKLAELRLGKGKGWR